MQRMQRKFGTFLPRTANDSEVGGLLTDFENAEQMLNNLIESTEQWRQAWSGVLSHQLLMTNEFDLLYSPIIAAGEHLQAHQPYQTPPDTLDRCHALRDAYTELKTDMAGEVNSVDIRIAAPAKDARDCLKPIKKVIKGREDKKLDYERYQSRVASLDKKSKLSDREKTALSKHQVDLERSTAEYKEADNHLRSVLPGILNATFSLLPHLLAAQIEIQNTLLGQLYTVLVGYADQYGFPNPPPELQDVIGPWEAEFTPLRKELESGNLLAHGKAIHQPMGQAQSSTLTGLNIRNGLSARRQSSNSTISTISQSRKLSTPTYNGRAPSVDANNKPRITDGTKPKIGSYSSHNGNLSTQHEQPGRTSSPGAEDYALSRTSTASSAKSQNDYFSQRPRIPSAPSLSGPSASSHQYSQSPSPGIGKKKPPPPPPPKKVGSFHGEYVTAMYDFDGQSKGDLSFNEGDRIKVLKKTQSSHDWWEGELRGLRGSFPANYVR